MKLKLAFISTVLFCGLLSTAIAAPVTPRLDGKTFSAQVLNAGAKKPDPDTLIFDKGTFHSTACDQYGFSAAPYSAHLLKGKMTFTSTTKNTEGAKIAWTGTVVKNTVSGKAIMTDAKGKKSSMSFKGTLTQ